MSREFLDTAFAIGAEICRDAIWWEDRCNWLSDELDHSFGQKEKLAAQSMGASLYSGAIGVAIFLARLSQRTGETWFEEHAVAAARQSLRSHEELTPHSFHSGRFGVAFGLIEIGTVLGHDELSTRGRELLAAIANDESEPTRLDVIAGHAGLLLGIADLAIRHEIDPPLDYCQRLSRLLQAAARESDRGISWKNLPNHEGPDLNGYAHGVAGNIAALHVVNHWLNDPEIHNLVAAGLRYERSWFDEIKGNWPDLRKVSETPPPGERKYMTAWCHGAPGIGLSRLQLSGVDHQVLEEARAAFTTTADHITKNMEAHTGNYSLCHGIAGNADILLSASGIINDPQLRQLAETAGRHGRESYGGNKPAWPNGFKWPGHTHSLMMGLAGTGYFYLRLDAPNETPTILGPGLRAIT